jgi:hypothetical protein
VQRSATSQTAEVFRSPSDQPSSPATPDSEHFTASERQGLEEVLKRKGAQE